MKKFNELYNTILEEITTGKSENTEIHPTCAYCGKDVPIEEYEKAKAYHEEQQKDASYKTEFKPNMCTCEKCAKELMDFYSNKSDNWRRRLILF